MASGLQLLGTPRIVVGERPTDLPLDRPASLGYYLAQRGDWVRRAELAYLYSPEADEGAAFANLRKLVYRLRQQGWAGALEADPARLRLRLPTDVGAFRAALERRDWAGALGHYGGPFLDGLAFPGLGGYEAWLEIERQDLARAWRTALLEHTRALEAQADWPGAEHWLSRLLKAEPLDEEAAQTLMRVLGAAGKVARAAEVFEQFRRDLRAEMGAEPLESTRALADSLRDRQTAVSAAPAEPARPKHNLPAPGTRFVGRGRELEALARQLANPECRLLTVVGLGGMGKTRLALELAAQQAGRFADGVWLVPLAGVSGPDLLAPAVAGALGLSFSGPSEPKAQLLNYLRNKELLLLLDNFEHLTEGGLLLEELLAQVPGLKLLVTSRVALELSSEWLHDLAGLAYPPPGAADLESYDSVRLFAGRAERLSSSFVLTAPTLGAIGELARRVQGMPLALELAATWVRGLGVPELVAQLGRSFDLLRTTQRDVPERHRNLQAVLAYTWGLLPEPEQLALARLSVFRGGFTLEAAHSVAGAHLGLLLRFINHALVRRGDDGRYDMHELVRQFAAERLGEGEKPGVYASFSGYFFDQLLALGAAVRGNIQRDTVAACRRELGNLFSTLDHLASAGDTARLSRALVSFYSVIEIAGLFENGVAQVDAVLAALEARNVEDQALRGGLEAVKAYFLIKIGEDEDAKRLAGSAIARLEPLPPTDLLGVAHYTAAIHAHLGGRLEEAKGWYGRALAAFEAAGNRSEQCRVLNRVAAVMKQLERYDESDRLYRQALELSAEIGDLSEQGIILNNYGINFESTGRVEEAIRMYKASLEICERIDYVRGQSAALTNLGHVHERRGEYAQAREYYEQSLRIKRALGEPVAIAISMTNLADVLYALGDDAAAHRINFQVIDETLRVNALVYTARSVWSFCKFFEQKGPLEGGLLLACFLSKTLECEQWVRDEADAMIATHAGTVGASALGQLRAQARGMDYGGVSAWLKHPDSPLPATAQGR